ncbi:MAG: hypothetical protein U9O87_11110 [Verrucomicrobiota bacterium]|nr:hypothetical protein [Verrucomicrobiota bacterium]
MNRIKLGVYADRNNITGEKIIERIGLSDVIQFEKLIDKKVDSVMWYPTWNTMQSKSNFPIESVKLVDQHGAIPHLTWELMLPDGDPLNSKIMLDDVISGKYDAYLTSYAKDVKKWGKEICRVGII